MTKGKIDEFEKDISNVYTKHNKRGFSVYFGQYNDIKVVSDMSVEGVNAILNAMLAFRRNGKVKTEILNRDNDE